MDAERDEDGQRRRRNGECEPRRPTSPKPKAKAGNKVGKARQKIEPDDEGHILAGREPCRLAPEQDAATLPDRQKSE